MSNNDEAEGDDGAYWLPDTTDGELGEFVYSNYLKEIFGTSDTKLLVKKIIRATKKDHSPELQSIMGDDYPEFQALTRKEKIARLGEKINTFCSFERRAFKRWTDRLEGRKAQRRENEEDVEDELDEQIQKTLKNFTIRSKIDEKDTNSSAMTIRKCTTEWNFKSALSFWKDVESKPVKEKIIEAIQKHRSAMAASTGCESFEGISPFADGSLNITRSCDGGMRRALLPKPQITEGDLQRYKVHLIYPYVHVQTRTPFYKRTYFILGAIALITLVVIALYYYYWRTPEPSCNLCDGIGNLLYHTAMELFIP